MSRGVQSTSLCSLRRKHKSTNTALMKPKRNTTEMECGLPNLPDEIIFNILSRLTVKPLCRFKSVSKPWLARITNPQFIKSHLNHHSTNDNNMTQKFILHSADFPSIYSVAYQAPDHTLVELERPCKSHVDILGSFNGILLLRVSDAELYLWNPSIRVFRKISPPKGSGIPMYGLGYDSVSDDFKVVRILWPTNYSCAVHVFSSKLSLWKRIGTFSYYIFFGIVPGMVLDGAPHWIMGRGIDINREVIVCFDATEEKIKEVPKPNCVGENGGIDLGVLGGCLCAIHNHQDSHADVWVMMEYGVKESWTKLFVVQNVPGDFNFLYLTLLRYTKDEKVVMVLDSEKLVIYNPKLNRFKSIGIPLEYDATLYMESLVSPHGCTGTRRRRHH